MKYRLVISSGSLYVPSFEIGESLDQQPFRMFTYEHLGIRDTLDWRNLFIVHLYENRIRLKKSALRGLSTSQRNDFVSIDTSEQYSPSDIIAYGARGYQILKNGDLTELYRPPTGKIVDEENRTYTTDQMMNIIMGGEKGFVKVDHV